MKKFKRAWDLNSKSWFIDHHPSGQRYNEHVLGKTPDALNMTMFLLTLTNMCDDEQAKKWLPMVRNFRWMGCYAQTELGHGSDVSGLETTATFDKATDEFIIHTPSITAAKWWPGDLGHNSSHAVVFAKCIIDGQKYGVLPFLLQIRETETWMPCKGCEMGDMGPKFGYNSKNNGWCTFNKVRIPRGQMLMKYTKVDKEGNFSVEGDIRALYSVMMDIRMQLIAHSANTILRGLLITLRYSVNRKQFKNYEDQPKLETKILDY